MNQYDLRFGGGVPVQTPGPSVWMALRWTRCPCRIGAHRQKSEPAGDRHQAQLASLTAQPSAEIRCIAVPKRAPHLRVIASQFRVTGSQLHVTSKNAFISADVVQRDRVANFARPRRTMWNGNCTKIVRQAT